MLQLIVCNIWLLHQPKLGSEEEGGAPNIGALKKEGPPVKLQLIPELLKSLSAQKANCILHHSTRTVM